MLKAFKYRIFPTDTQKEAMANTFGQVRFVYNLGLETKVAAYTMQRKNISVFDLINQVKELKDNEADWLKESPAQALQMSLRNLDNAYTSFFRGGGFPKFKSKHKKQSYQLPQGVKVDFENNKVFIPKLKDVDVDFHRTFKGEVKTTTITRTVTNKYFVSILVDNGKDLPKPKLVKEETAVGLDFGIKDLIITSDNEIFENKKYFVSQQRKLRIEQRSLARKVKGSNSRKRQKLKVALIHEKIANQRKDYLHKISTQMVRDYDTICVEDLAVSNMVKNHNLAKAISDTSWGELRRMLEYKADWYGKNIIIIDRFFPSSKTCSVCGTINKELKLSDRTWTCKNGHTHDRDLNAAINIKVHGLRNKPIGRKRSALAQALPKEAALL